MNNSKEVKYIIQYFIQLNKKGIISNEELNTLIAQSYAGLIEVKFNNSLNKTYNRFEKKFVRALANA